MSKAAFKKQVEDFLGKTDMNATNFGREAVSDPSFVFNLRKGRECRERTRLKVIAFIEANSSILIAQSEASA